MGIFIFILQKYILEPFFNKLKLSGVDLMEIWWITLQIFIYSIILGLFNTYQ